MDEVLQSGVTYSMGKLVPGGTPPVIPFIIEDVEKAADVPGKKK